MKGELGAMYEADGETWELVNYHHQPVFTLQNTKSGEFAVVFNEKCIHPSSLKKISDGTEVKNWSKTERGFMFKSVYELAQ